jgi:hypothetical protein
MVHDPVQDRLSDLINEKKKGSVQGRAESRAGREAVERREHHGRPAAKQAKTKQAKTEKPPPKR